VCSTSGHDGIVGRPLSKINRLFANSLFRQSAQSACPQQQASHGVGFANRPARHALILKTVKTDVLVETEQNLTGQDSVVQWFSGSEFLAQVGEVAGEPRNQHLSCIAMHAIDSIVRIFQTMNLENDGLSIVVSWL
jgi:hypothetical protein